MIFNRNKRSVAALLTTAMLVAGCSWLPDSGPSTSAITDGATVVGEPEDGTVGFKYALMDVSKQVLPYISEDGNSLAKTLGMGGSIAPEVRVGVGDTLQVTIFESAAGGLFIPNDAGSRPGNFVQMPAQIIDRGGGLSVPYAGSVPTLGRTLPQIQLDIEKRLAGRAIEPQAIVTLVTQKSNDVSVVGDVNAPNKFDVPPGGERVLDLIARGGGLKKDPYNSSVTVSRGGRKATIAFNTLISNPSENVFVGSGDTIYVYSEAKSYVAFGATGSQAKVDFGSEKVSLAEAVAKADGLNDSRADPARVFIYRLEHRKALEKMGVDISKFGDKKEIPTIYRANFRDPASFFAARNFNMRDKDIIYVSNSVQTELTKFLSLIDSVSATVSNTSGDIVTTRDAWHQIGRAPHR